MSFIKPKNKGVGKEKKMVSRVVGSGSKSMGSECSSLGNGSDGHGFIQFLRHFLRNKKCHTNVTNTSVTNSKATFMPKGWNRRNSLSGMVARAKTVAAFAQGVQKGAVANNEQ
jgi:hypothetical protein